MRVTEAFQAWLDDAAGWCRGRSAWLRLPLCAYLAYAGVRHGLDEEYRSWFAGLTLVFHEMGHLLFSPFGFPLHILGGTLLQLAVPVLAALHLYWSQRDYFGVSVSAAWLSFSLWEAGHYVYDANKGLLPLVGFSDHPEHDWDVLLTHYRVLNQCELFAYLAYASAFSIWLCAMAFALWLLWTMLQRPEACLEKAR